MRAESIEEPLLNKLGITVSIDQTTDSGAPLLSVDGDRNSTQDANYLTTYTIA